MTRKKVRVYFQKDLYWLVPYTRAVKSFVPLRKLESVKGYRVRYAGQDVTEGQCLTGDFKKYTITLATHLRVKKKAKRRMLCNILQTYAHELAHLTYWDHSPAHYALEAKIMGRFALVMKRLGVKDSTTRKYE